LVSQGPLTVNASVALQWQKVHDAVRGRKPNETSASACLLTTQVFDALYSLKEGN
jgi:hypothetical protein